ncbi:MAG TPA: pitrilysin family protein [Polyangiaceae bacterium]|jgi:zinc protease
MRGVLFALAWTLSCGSPPAVRPPTPVTSASANLSAPAPDPDAWRNQQPKPGAAALPEFPAPETVRLDNGLSIYVVKRAAPVATLSLVIRHGAASAPEGKSGLAALTARMLAEGTQRHSQQELAEASENLGATLETGATRDESHLELETLSADVPQGLALLAEVALSPAFRERDFSRVRDEWLDAVKSDRKDPPRLAVLVALRALFGLQAGASVNGSVPDVEKLTARELAAFHRQAYVPSNMALIVVGDLTLADVRAHAERLFGRVKGAPFAPPTAEPTPRVPEKVRVLVVDRKDSVQSSLVALQPLPKRSAPDYEKRALLGTVIGGLFTSRLNLNLREEHAYTYGAGGQVLGTRLWGAYLVSTDVKTENTADALHELISELERAHDPKRAPIRDDEADRARNALIHALGASLEHTSEVADAIRTTFVHELKPDYYARYPKLIEGISTAEIGKQTALLQPEHLLVVIVGDRSAIEPGLRQRGFELEAADPTLLE